VTYEEFIAGKVDFEHSCGLPCEPEEINPLLKPHQRDIVQWAIRGGRRAIFAAFGLGKTFIQLEIGKLISEKTQQPFLICAPLGVRQEFRRDAEKLGIQGMAFGKSTEELLNRTRPQICLTNYESVRDRKIDVSLFAGISLDEASILRGFGGTKTFREMMRLFEGSGKYRFVATATPSPNEYIELLAYAAFLDVMDVGQAKTRFFKRDSTKADSLTLHAHKEREFWLWVSSWAIFLQKPSDLGYSDEGYSLPDLEVYWHEVPSDHKGAGFETSGQGKLLRNAAIGVTDAAAEKRNSLPARIQKLMELRALDPDAHRLIWHDLESERKAIEDALPVNQMRFDKSIAAATVYGSQDLDEREQIILDFSDGKIQELAAKPVLAGSGCNFQYHCSWEIFLGIGFKFNDFIQAVHRCYRFQQTERVRVDLIYTEAEREIRRNLERKWEQHKELTAQMSDIIRQYGLASEALAHELKRSIGVQRSEIEGENFRIVNNDCVLEARSMQSESIHLVLTSIPFSTQYEYTPSYNDFGHTDSNQQFFEQMDYLTPQLYRLLKPGRIAAIHVKDRIMPSGLTGLGFQTLYPFSDETVRHFIKHGFGFLGRKTIVTDVVRENNQTYRLGWTEQCKDGTKMGYGLPEYLLLFRKPPTDRSNGYADEPVVKNKTDYTRSRWQIDAHGFARSSGNRLLSAQEIEGLKHEQIFKLFRKYSQSSVYNFENHVALSESLERCMDCKHIHTGDKKCDECDCPKAGGRLPVTFMLLQPASWHPDVWTDITRMLSLNSAQSASGREMHLCPLQFDLADRVITQLSMPGEVVMDPFGGLMTVPLRAIKLKRYGIGVELNTRYFLDGAAYCKAEEQRQAIPDLFAAEELEATA